MSLEYWHVAAVKFCFILALSACSLLLVEIKKCNVNEGNIDLLEGAKDALLTLDSLLQKLQSVVKVS